MKNIYLTLMGVTMLAAGCGGGGSATPTAGGKTVIPTAAVQITQANASKAAKAGGSSQSSAQGGGTSAGAVGVVVTQSLASPKALWQRARDKFEQAQTLKQLPSASVVGAIAGFAPIITQCLVSGTSTFDIKDTNNSGVIDAGDVYVITDASCIDMLGYSSSGTITLAFDATPGNCLAANPSPTSLTLAVTLTNYVDVSPVEVLTSNGDMTIAMTDDCTTMTATISGNNYEETSSVDGVTQMSNYNISYTEDSAPTLSSPYSYTISMTVASVELGGTVTITTPTPLSGIGSGEPTAGVMVITGAGNSTLTLTANANGIDVAEVLDVDGATGSTAPVDLAPTTWAAI